MRTYTVCEYEQQDFDEIRDNMSAEEAIAILDSLPRGYFPYNLPDWDRGATSYDFEHYRICCALDFAINAIREVGK